jgi:hypothetical protein
VKGKISVDPWVIWVELTVELIQIVGPTSLLCSVGWGIASVAAVGSRARCTHAADIVIVVVVVVDGDEQSSESLCRGLLSIRASSSIPTRASSRHIWALISMAINPPIGVAVGLSFLLVHGPAACDLPETRPFLGRKIDSNLCGES